MLCVSKKDPFDYKVESIPRLAYAARENASSFAFIELALCQSISLGLSYAIAVEPIQPHQKHTARFISAFHPHYRGWNSMLLVELSGTAPESDPISRCFNVYMFIYITKSTYCQLLFNRNLDWLQILILH